MESFETINTNQAMTTKTKTELRLTKEDLFNAISQFAEKQMDGHTVEVKDWSVDVVTGPVTTYVFEAEITPIK